jgi:hypothetical protein
MILIPVLAESRRELMNSEADTEKIFFPADLAPQRWDSSSRGLQVVSMQPTHAQQKLHACPAQFAEKELERRQPTLLAGNCRDNPDINAVEDTEVSIPEMLFFEAPAALSIDYLQSDVSARPDLAARLRSARHGSRYFRFRSIPEAPAHAELIDVGR